MNDSVSPKTSSFMRLRQEGRAEEVVRKLVELVNLGIFVEGQQLPSETELSTQFGVATVTLREALSLLRERGYIETRRGRSGGSFICPFIEIPVSQLYSRIKEISAPELRDFGDEHAAISSASARLAAQRASAEHLSRLDFYNSALADSVSRTDRRRMDARFHIEVSASAQSLRLTHAEMVLQAEMGELLWVSKPGEDFDLTKICAEHAEISSAISVGDANLAGALADAHVRTGIKRLNDVRLSLVTADALAKDATKRQ